MQLYWSPRTRSFTALWILEEAGQPYERVLVDMSVNAQKSPEYLAVTRWARCLPLMMARPRWVKPRRSAPMWPSAIRKQN